MGLTRPLAHLAFTRCATIALLGILLQNVSLTEAFGADEECGGYRNRVLTGYLYGYIPADPKDHAIICSIGQAVQSQVLSGEWNRQFADSVWDQYVFNIRVCAQGKVKETPLAKLEELSGQHVILAARYCGQTSNTRTENFLVVLSEQTSYLRNESFCELATTMFSSGPATYLNELGQSLCKDVRSSTVDVDVAHDRWDREVRRSKENFIKRMFSWMVSGVFEFVVTILGVVFTLVTIAVQLKKLRE